MSRFFILATLFITLTLALLAQSAPAANYVERCPPATFKDSINQFRFPPAEGSNREPIYFSQDNSNPLEARKCDYCGGMTAGCCSSVCGCLGYSYYKCLECQCGCGN